MGVRHTGFLYIAAAFMIIGILLISTGCGKITGNSVRTVSVEKRPIVNTVEQYEEQPYTEQETRIVGETCIERHYSEMNDSQFTIVHEDKEWVEQPAAWGQSNHLRRVVLIHNARDELDAVYVDKVYYFKGNETKRSRHPMMFMVDPKSTRKLYVMWDTQYHPDKDVKLEFTNHTDELGFDVDIMRMCYNETETVNVTKYKKVLTGIVEEVGGYEDVTRVVLE